VLVGSGGGTTSPPASTRGGFDEQGLLDGECTRIYCDLNLDGHVNMLDMILLRNVLNEAESQGAVGKLRYYDLNDDGYVNAGDLLVLSANLLQDLPYEVTFDSEELVWGDAWNRTPWNLTLSMTCSVRRGVGVVPVPGGIKWEVTEGGIVCNSWNKNEGIGESEILVARAHNTLCPEHPDYHGCIDISVIYRECVIGTFRVRLRDYIPDSHNIDNGCIVDNDDEVYHGVFTLPGAVLDAGTALIHWDIEDAVVVMAATNLEVFDGEEEITGDPYTVSYPWSLSVTLHLSCALSSSMGDLVFHPYIEEGGGHAEHLAYGEDASTIWCCPSRCRHRG